MWSLIPSLFFPLSNTFCIGRAVDFVISNPLNNSQWLNLNASTFTINLVTRKPSPSSVCTSWFTRGMKLTLISPTGRRGFGPAWPAAPLGAATEVYTRSIPRIGSRLTSHPRNAQRSRTPWRPQASPWTSSLRTASRKGKGWWKFHPNTPERVSEVVTPFDDLQPTDIKESNNN